MHCGSAHNLHCVIEYLCGCQGTKGYHQARGQPKLATLPLKWQPSSSAFTSRLHYYYNLFCVHSEEGRVGGERKKRKEKTSQTWNYEIKCCCQNFAHTEWTSACCKYHEGATLAPCQISNWFSNCCDGFIRLGSGGTVHLFEALWTCNQSLFEIIWSK